MIRTATLALACVAALAAPALAVDRTLGANVPKPSASGAPWTGAQIAALAAKVDAALAGAPAVRGAHAGVFAIDARSGRVLYARNAGDAFQPASTFKLLVGSAALDKLGPDQRFVTRVEQRDSELVVVAGGDPFLRMADVTDAATAVANAGVKALSRVTVDAGRYAGPPYAPGWNWDDFPYYYAPKISAATFEENVVHVTATPGAAPGAPVTLAVTPFGSVANGTVTGAASSASSFDVGTPAADGTVTTVGSVPAGGKADSADGTVADPERYLHDAFVLALQRAGVRTDGAILAAGSDTPRTLWTHQSEPLRDTLADMWFPSDNLVAELLLRETGFAAGGAPGTLEKGAAFEAGWLRRFGVDPATVSISDGSGLSGYDRITPRALVAILKHDWDGPYRDLVLDDLPVAGVRGTMRNDLKGSPAVGKVFAKTGSVSHVRTLAGYAATATHGAVIFAFLIDDALDTDRGDVDAARARVLSRIVEM